MPNHVEHEDIDMGKITKLLIDIGMLHNATNNALCEHYVLGIWRECSDVWPITQSHKKKQ